MQQQKNQRGLWRQALLLAGWLMGFAWSANAAVTDISSNPLSTASGTVVRPNVMFVLDDSGSMNFNFMPDYVGYSQHNYKCRKGQNGRTNSGNGRCEGAVTDGQNKITEGGDPPVYSHYFNAIYYNPNVSYTPPVSPCDVTQYLPSMTSGNTNGWKSVRVNGHSIDNTCTQNSGIANLVTGYPELYYCTTNSNSNCMRNGKDNRVPTPNNEYDNQEGDYDWPFGDYTRAVTKQTSNPHYFQIFPKEHCTNNELSECTLSATPTATHPVPAYVRFCRTSNFADDSTSQAVSGLSGDINKCQSKLDDNHLYARYGNFKRIDIVSGATYAKSVDRIDCAGASCSYAEEMTNFANWYAYYRTRMMTMKTAAGAAFSTIDNSYRVGFVTINPSRSGEVWSEKYLKIDNFEPTHKQNWYQKFYASKVTANETGSGTPLRQALSRVGRHYAGITSGINNGMGDDPVQFACQQNFTILTTDGYWNGAAGVTVGGQDIGNQDNEDSEFSRRVDGAFDGALSGATNTLADVSMYYYKTDLRPNMDDKVPTTSKDKNAKQHMNTFTLGLGLDGEMNYRSDYEIANDGDFAMIKQGAIDCHWNPGNNTCNWPVPQANAPSTLDDLWHAAVNGRGLYFSAKQPKELISGLRSALAGVSDRTGAAAASATSSPNITQTDNYIFSSTYRSVHWDGDVQAQTINPADGTVSEAHVWSAQAQLSGGRSIFKFNRDTKAIEPFAWDNLSTEEKAYFNNKCELLSQCNGFNAETKEAANSGENLLNYLRGQSVNSGEVSQTDKAYRLRTHLLGDIVNSAPAYVKQPRFNFIDNVAPNYQTFKNDHADRHGMLYVGGNDGMLHAFNTTNGNESWAYVPQSVMPNLYKLADKNYGANHQFLVDGSPQVMDVYDAATSAWRTILVGGLNAGGRGYYALDVTDEDNPKALWEFCHTNSYCNRWDEDLGLTYGNPIITKLPEGNARPGRWVVIFTSGYNNVSPGNGQGYLYIVDAITGELLDKVGTGVGTAESPSGFAKLASSSGINGNADINATSVAVYGGDLEGNLWKVNLEATSLQAVRMAKLTDPNGLGQPITTRPEIGKLPKVAEPVIFVATGRYLGLSDVTNTQVQSVYAIRDNGVSYNGRALTPRTITHGDTTSSIAGSDLDWAGGGWYVDLPESRERVNLDPQLALGTLTVNSNTPQIDNVNSDGCSLGGTTRVYQFDYRTGLMVPGATHFGQKLATGLSVGMVIVRLPNGQLKAIITDAQGRKTTIGIDTAASDSVSRRTGWRELTK
ncbi:pilus assembly protein [Methylobacillus sp. Pita1]|uniref:pilus assembly protein n=1 Tax=Methylobacillus sp. Pita1 TaxID=3382642 RepID=UPI0038B64E99